MPAGLDRSEVPILASLTSDALLATGKLLASVLTSSTAMLSEAVHSLAHTNHRLLDYRGTQGAARRVPSDDAIGYDVNASFLAYSLLLSAFAAGSALAFYNGFEQIHSPLDLDDAWLNLLVLGIALPFETWAWLRALDTYRARKTAAGRAGDRPGHAVDPRAALFEDSAAMLGLTIATLGIALALLLDLPVLDGIASILIGTVMATATISRAL